MLAADVAVTGVSSTRAAAAAAAASNASSAAASGAHTAPRHGSAALQARWPVCLSVCLSVCARPSRRNRGETRMFAREENDRFNAIATTNQSTAPAAAAAAIVAMATRLLIRPVISRTVVLYCNSLLCNVLYSWKSSSAAYLSAARAS